MLMFQLCAAPNVFLIQMEGKQKCLDTLTEDCEHSTEHKVFTIRRHI